MYEQYYYQYLSDNIINQLWLLIDCYKIFNSKLFDKIKNKKFYNKSYWFDTNQTIY